MKATGIVRKMDELGCVVLPIELRRQFGIAEKDSLEIYTDGSNIILRKYSPGCSACGAASNLTTRGGVKLCHDCVAEFAETPKEQVTEE